MRNVTLGVVGLGNMGRGIANNIARAGYDLAVWDVAGSALRPFEGKAGVSVLAPAEMARRCAAIFFVVPGTPEIEPMLRGRTGILAHARRGREVMASGHGRLSAAGTCRSPPGRSPASGRTGPSPRCSPRSGR